MSSPPWTNVWNESTPADSDLANTLGTQGRQVKLDVRQRLDWQHVWNVDVNHDGGHRFVAIESAYHPINTSSFASAGYSLTVANAQSVVDLAGTWNTSGTPTGIKLNILDSASNAASLLIDLQIGGTSKFKVDKSGNATFVGSVTASSFVGAATSGLVQTVQVITTTETPITSSYAAATGIAVTITPTKNTNRVRIQVSINAYVVSAGGAIPAVSAKVVRSGSTLVQEFLNIISALATGQNSQAQCVLDCIDSPATTSATTYTVQVKYGPGVPSTSAINHDLGAGTPASTITATEIV